MTRPWLRWLALPTALALTLLSPDAIGVAKPSPGTTFTCTNMSPIFYGPPESFVIAWGCEGPIGYFQNVSFRHPSPVGASWCETASSYQVDGHQGLDVTGHSCI
jgi:hypothetical protein